MENSKDTSRDLFPGALEMMILESLRRQPAHGYALVQHIQQRSNNLLQVEEGSLYPALQRLLTAKTIGQAEAANAVAACAEGYSFPTNLDRDPPKGGMAPKTQQDLMRQALKEKWSSDMFSQEAQAQAERKLT